MTIMLREDTRREPRDNPASCPFNVAVMSAFEAWSAGITPKIKVATNVTNIVNASTRPSIRKSGPI